MPAQPDTFRSSFTSSSKHPPTFLSRDERIKQFGLDCGEGLLWHGWEPGGDYSQKLVVKNVSGATQKIIYKLPATKFFYMEYPEVKLLSPGMTFSITVNFRPVVAAAYNDFIEFNTQQGTFFMEVRATLPKMAVSIVDEIDFGFVPVKEETTQYFTIQNVGDVETPFRWKVDEPFKLVPSQGSIKPGHSITLALTIFPVQASSLEGKLECFLAGGKMIELVTVRACCKYAYIRLEKRTVDFGDVFSGKRKDYTLKLKNQGSVRSSFTVKQLSKEHEPVVFVKPLSGLLQAGQEMDIQLSYTPQVTNTFTNEVFLFETPGGNNEKLTLCGTATGPVLHFSTSMIDFGDVPAGEKVKREIRLHNESDCPAFYQFLDDELGSFSIDVPSGVVPALVSAIVNVTFRPHQPINYYKRVFCLIKNQTPHYVDVLGTCFTDLVRPAPLTTDHVLRYRHRALTYPHLRRTDTFKLLAAGLDDGLDETGFSEELGGGISSSYFAYEQLLNESVDPHAEASVQELSIDFGSQSHMRMSEYRTIHVTNHTDFKQTVMWDIPTQSDNPNAKKIKSPLFMVFPPSADVRPKSTIEFKISFRPRRSNFYYCQRLEAYVYSKSNRTFRLVNDAGFVPPLKIQTMVFGHTFPPNTEQFMPQAEFSVVPSKRIEFPACTVGSCQYMTVQLTNRGDTPLAFNFPQPEDNGQMFRITPSCGLLKQNAFALLSLMVTAKTASQTLAKLVDTGEFVHTFGCVLNNNFASPVQLRMVGRGYGADLHFVDGPVMTFRPTCQGMLSRRVQNVKNNSRVPMDFSWEIPNHLKDIIRVTPAQGTLKGHELAQITWEFIPNEIKAYQMKVPVVCTTKETGKDGSAHKQRSLLTIKGSCTNGIVEFSPPALELGTVQIGTSGKRTEFTLINSSDCTLNYRLNVLQTRPVAMPAIESKLKTDGRATPIPHPNTQRGLPAKSEFDVLEFDHPVGELPARSHKKILVMFRPEAATFHSFTISCELGNSTSTSTDLGATWQIAAPPPVVEEEEESPRLEVLDSNGKPLPGSAGKKSRARRKLDSAMAQASQVQKSQQQSYEILPSNNDSTFANQTMECVISATGGFPLIAVSDIRSQDGSNIYQPLDAVYKQFSVENINIELQQPLSAVEKDLNADESHTVAFKSGDLTPLLKQFDFDFGTGVIRSDAKVVFMKVENVGLLDVNWSVSFPEDMDVRIDYWADTGDPTKQERWQQAIVDRDLFLVHPRTGFLKAGESAVVQLTYFHKYLGVHELPIILQIAKGKKVVFNLIGRTLKNFPPVFDLTPFPKTRSFVSDGRSTPGSPLITLTHKLESVMLNLKKDEIPVQLVPLTNHSKEEIQYQVDLDTLREAAAENFGMDVWKCLNPSGVIGPNQVGYLRLIFAPLEAKEYSLQLMINFPAAHVKQDSQEVTITGSGFVLDDNSTYNPEIFEIATDDAIKSTSFPLYQSITCPGQLARVSNDILCFGDLPRFAMSHIVLTLESLCDTPCRFQWPNLSEDLNETVALTFEPSSGTLQPRQKMLIRVKLAAGATPIVFDRDLACELVKEDVEEEEDDFSATKPLARSPEKPDVAVDTYGRNNIESERLAMRNSVVTNSTLSSQAKVKPPVAEQIDTNELTAGETLTERAARMATGGGAPTIRSYTQEEVELLTVTANKTDTNPTAHLSVLADRKSGSISVRAVCRVFHVNVLEKLQKAGRSRVRTQLASEIDMNDRFWVAPGDGAVADLAHASAADPQHDNLVAEHFLTALLEDLLGESALHRVFDDLKAPSLPYFDPSYQPCDSANPLLASDQKAELSDVLKQKAADTELERQTLKRSKAEFSELAHSLVSQTLVNLVQEAAHKHFDLATLPRQVVTEVDIHTYRGTPTPLPGNK
mmetsp:Transcript_36466/g.71614  ORF Transcript_36466/g.71614 Transcript_36466/m.71614 type:complete len:1880 (+) Transcript_36466:91-5730(+)|eukprot:CAMPEP_0175138106 /NCGR_PEP_ID=MMETSP0087-20121206/10167_1 /TAXON_ID=136419 /ORGANISM="Unknown Unknown, Strain D1" /LENGTH=1879 /DNA_ID=CAMNT_0016420977 /DNA_START=90 /DNA_END=5729 /DNA_ORIENTATION=-